jgi:hypothetical protein
MADVLRVHDYAYIKKVQDVCARLDAGERLKNYLFLCPMWRTLFSVCCGIPANVISRISADWMLACDQMTAQGGALGCWMGIRP